MKRMNFLCLRPSDPGFRVVYSPRNEQANELLNQETLLT